MAASDTDGWIDITQEFKDACVELQVGELVHDVGFGLYEAMSAFEMMDPKMDSGIIDANSSKLPPKTFASCQASGELKLGIISHNECSDIVDGTLCCIASWLEGGSMAQTVFANLYLHNPFSIDDRVMRAVCVTVLKLVSVVKELITSTCVYEEDHFQPMTHGFQLADSITPQRVLGLSACSCYVHVCRLQFNLFYAKKKQVSARYKMSQINCNVLEYSGVCCIPVLC